MTDTRPAQSDEVDWLSALFLLAMQESISAARGYWDPAREDAQFRAQLRIAETRVIRHEGTDVGFLTLRTLGANRTEIHTLCVRSGRQGQGVGTRVMQDLMATAKDAGSKIELSVLKPNTRARAFYARLGFEVVGTSRHHVRMIWKPVAV
jgi:ribosomal protein S18 acetylase RimI-like enzyme